jgi:hypothetical protein
MAGLDVKAGLVRVKAGLEVRAGLDVKAGLVWVKAGLISAMCVKGLGGKTGCRVV